MLKRPWDRDFVVLGRSQSIRVAERILKCLRNRRSGDSTPEPVFRMTPTPKSLGTICRDCKTTRQRTSPPTALAVGVAVVEPHEFRCSSPVCSTACRAPARDPHGTGRTDLTATCRSARTGRLVARSRPACPPFHPRGPSFHPRGAWSAVPPCWSAPEMKMF